VRPVNFANGYGIHAATLTARGDWSADLMSSWQDALRPEVLLRGAVHGRAVGSAS